MIIAAHQPQYIPWIGYFHKIAHSDAFVYLDNVQYKKREFQNRNKIRTKDGWMWLTVPVVTKGRYYQGLFEVEIDDGFSWRNDHWKGIELNYRKARHFAEHKDFFNNVYSNKWEKLVDLNARIIDYLLGAFQIKLPIYYGSKLDIPGTKTDRIIQICKKLNADTYLSGQGARRYLEEGKFEKAGIKLVWQDFVHPEYPQAYEGFQPYMSVIDLLFNCGSEGARILKGG